MADNVNVKPSADIDAKPVRSEEIGGIQHQWMVPVWGPLGTANRTDVASGKPLPIQVRSATGLIPIGEPTDNRSTATDATSTTLVSIFKQISFSIQAAAASLASLVSAVVGTIAHGDPDSGNNSKIGGKAVTALSAEAPVTDGDRTDALFDLDGSQISAPVCAKGDVVRGRATNTDGTATPVIATGGVGIYQWLKKVTFSNSSAADIECNILSGSTVVWTVPVPAGGCTVLFPDHGLPPNDANEGWSFDPSAATTTITCSMLGYQSKLPGA